MSIATLDARQRLRSARIVFWDFDGVIKESVAAKGEAFERVFAHYGNDVATRVRRHHDANGGVSRYEKVPLYLEWAGVAPDAALTAATCDAFASEARAAVIRSAWVPGAREYLETRNAEQEFVVVSATPEDELKSIIDELGLSPFLRAVYGSPDNKSASIARYLAAGPVGAVVARDAAVMIGDTESDWRAAREAGIGFILRRTPLNRELEQATGCLALDDFQGLAADGPA